MNPFWKLFTRSDFDAAPEAEAPPVSALMPNPDYVYWGMHDIPVTEATEHFLACGTIGSGKTTVIRLFLQSIGARFTAEHSEPEQLVIFDAKGNVLPILAGLKPPLKPEDVWILNPFDERGVKWNIGEAIDSPAMARYLASLLVPQDQNTTAPYFTNAAQEIVCWVAIALMNICGKAWTLRDLLVSLESRKRILDVCSRFSRAEIVVRQHTDDTQHFPSVLSSIATKVGKYHEVAALWDSSPENRYFSVTEFLKKPGVLVLGHDPVLHESMWPINAVILRALTNEILRRPDTTSPRHWFILDEFRVMQRVDCIRDLLNLGRSKGASVMLGVQSVEGLYEIYGRQAADEILGLCSNKTFLRAGGPATAEWAERHFSRIRQMETTVSYSRNKDGTTTNTNNSIHERSLFLASMFLNLASPTKGGPFQAISDIPSIPNVVINEWLFDDVLAMLKPVADIPGVQRRDNPADQILRPWSAREQKRICNTTSPDTPLAAESGPLTTRQEQQERRYGDASGTGPSGNNH